MIQYSPFVTSKFKLGVDFISVEITVSAQHLRAKTTMVQYCGRYWEIKSLVNRKVIKV